MLSNTRNNAKSKEVDYISVVHNYGKQCRVPSAEEGGPSPHSPRPYLHLIINTLLVMAS